MIILGFCAQFVDDARVVLRVSLGLRVTEVDRLDRHAEAQPQLGCAVVDVELLDSLGDPDRRLLPSALFIRVDAWEARPESTGDAGGEGARQALSVILLVWSGRVGRRARF